LSQELGPASQPCRRPASALQLSCAILSRLVSLQTLVVDRLVSTLQALFSCVTLLLFISTSCHHSGGQQYASCSSPTSQHAETSAAQPPKPCRQPD
jgi:hypothetical protein